jgi:hypothetical protein
MSTRRATFLLVVFVAVIAAPAPALAQSIGGGSGGSCFLGICDPEAWLRDVVSHIVAGFLGGLISGIGGAITSFPNDIDFLLRTPEALSYRNDTVIQFAAASQMLANGLLAVITLVGGFNVLLRPYLGSSYASALELLPRLLLGAILINTAQWWYRLAIDANNAFCAVFGAGPPTNLADTLARSMLPTELLIGLIYVVMGLLLVLQQLMRLALVDVLLILAPVGALCWILPQTHSWGKLWGTLFIGTVFAQAVQVLTLSGESRKFRYLLRRGGGGRGDRSGPVVGPGAEVVIDRNGEFLERAFVGQRFPPLVSIQREAVDVSAERRESKAGIRALLVGATHDQVATSHGDAHAVCRVADLEQDLEVWDDGRQP